MHASLTSVRIAPKKANLMAKLVRGLPVPTAIELLRKTHKKSARLFEGVILSAIANAQHNFKQDAQMMIVKEIIVNQGTSYRRGTPMARGRVRPIRKFLSHISVTLGFAGDTAPKKVSKKKIEKSTSQVTKKPVKTPGSPKKKTSSDSSHS
jgi:large subunit ribosomal protein L22